MSVRAPHVCLICGCEVAPRNGTPKNPSFPFCSPACKVVDLARWFDGTYRIPTPAELSSSSSSGERDDDGGSGEERPGGAREDDE